MIALHKVRVDSATPKCTPNLLPCRIHRDGPVNASSLYWSPEIGQDGKPEAHFRGRKLKGSAVKVPEGCRGIVVKGDPKPLHSQKQAGKITEEPDLESEATESEMKILEEVGEFDQLMVWGHEATVESDDPFVKGVDEWINFAASVHSYDQPRHCSPGRNA